MLFKNRRPLMGIAFVAAAMVLVAGSSLRARAQATNQDEVIKLQKQFQDAVIKGDTKTVGSLMTDDAFFIHGNGAMQNKTEFLAAIANAPFSGYDLKDPKVVFFDGGAIVSGLVDITFSGPAGATAPPRVIHMRGSSVWVHKSSGWLLLLDQDTSIPEPPHMVPATH
ncbi:MAG: nuclear transport factor 2 family protein [Acidobacteriia bacterium]|nr:nuclear transport factor 2 family protein [Terriglobia bacterium]